MKTTNTPVLYPPKITGIRKEGTNIVVDAMASPGYSHSLMTSTNLNNWSSYAGVGSSFNGDTNQVPLQFTKPTEYDFEFYRVKSE